MRPAAGGKPPHNAGNQQKQESPLRRRIVRGEKNSRGGSVMLEKKPGVRLIGSALDGVMIFGTALGAEAATKKKVVKKPVKHTRTVTLSYTGGCTVDLDAGASEGFATPGACSVIGAANEAQTAKVGEKFVSIAVKDASGRSVPGEFIEKGSGTGNDTAIRFCGAMKNYQFPADGSVSVSLDAAGAVSACPGFATQGTITLVFSNLR